MQENNSVITTKKGKGKLPLFCGNGEQIIPIYSINYGAGAWHDARKKWIQPKEIVECLASAHLPNHNIKK